MENRLVVTKREGGGSGTDGEFGVGRCKLLHLKCISNEVLEYSTGNSIESLVIEWKIILGKGVCVCERERDTGSLCCITEIDTTL